jgi:hypothetical protein
MQLRSANRLILTVFSFATLVSAQVQMRKEAAIYEGNNKPAVVKARPLSFSNPVGAPGAVRLQVLSQAESAKLGDRGPNRQIGVHRNTPGDILSTGVWTQLADGRSIWRVSITSPGAAGIRVHFTNASLGGGQLWLYANDGGESDGPFTAQGPYANGDFWSATVAGEQAIIEYAAPAGSDTSSLPFEVDRVSHQTVRMEAELAAGQAEFDQLLGFKKIVPMDDFVVPTKLPDYAAPCNLDVNCYTDWQVTKRSVAHIQFEVTTGDAPGTYVCSASLVSTRDNSFKPYMLTAGHCINDESQARSLQTWWAYESTGCSAGSPYDKGALKSSNGGHLLSWSHIHDGDYSLVLLPDVPSGVVFSGWDIGDPALGSSVVGIHHPAGSYKRISFGTTVSSSDVIVENQPAPGALYTSVTWNRGIAQPGSSGSPLFTAPGVIVGMLTYGPALPGNALCAGTYAVGYGKFSNAYPYLMNYLENLPFSEVLPAVTSLSFTGKNRQLIGAATQSVKLTTQTASPVPFTIRPDSPWIITSVSSGNVSASAPATFTVTLDPKNFVKTGHYSGTITILSGAAPPQFINVTLDMKTDVSNVVVTSVPNPVPQINGTWSLRLHLAETGGADTKLTGLKIDGDDYSSNIVTWFTTDTLPANGTLDANISTQGLFAPVDKYFEFYGTDVATGATWYRSLVVTFLP